MAIVTALVNCPASQRAHVEVALAQGSVVGHGVREVACVGRLARYPVTVAAHGHSGFVLGPGHADADAIVRDRGTVVDTQHWGRNVTVHADVSDASDDDADDRRHHGRE